MYPTNDLRTFLHKNDSEFRTLVYNICRAYNCTDLYEDIRQDLYMKFLKFNVIEKYDQKWATKISSYIYVFVRNHVLSEISRLKMFRHLCIHDFDSYLEFLSHESKNVNPSYQNSLLNNNESDNSDGLGTDLKLFGDYLTKHPKRNLKFKCTKNNKECSLLDLLIYIKEGVSLREIAEIYEVTPMAIHHFKKRLAVTLKKYGIERKHD